MELERLDGVETPQGIEIEITHAQGYGKNGWVGESTEDAIGGLVRLVYVGKCAIDGDMFLGYTLTAITMYKGSLNDGIIPDH